MLNHIFLDDLIAHSIIETADIVTLRAKAGIGTGKTVLRTI